MKNLKSSPILKVTKSQNNKMLNDAQFNRASSLDELLNQETSSIFSSSSSSSSSSSIFSSIDDSTNQGISSSSSSSSSFTSNFSSLDDATNQAISTSIFSPIFSSYFSSCFLKEPAVSTDFIIDSGCNGANIVNDSSLLYNVQGCDRRVRGVGGFQQATQQGHLPLAGSTLVLPQVPVNLIGLHNLLLPGFSFSGTSEHLSILDQENNEVLRSTRKDSGFWTVSLSELQHAESLINKNFQNQNYVVVDGKHFTPEDVRRAKLCRHQHNCLGHPSDAVHKLACDHNSFSPFMRAKDVENANILLGPAPCAEAKIKAPVNSHANPFGHEIADEIGEFLYIDLKPLYNGQDNQRKSLNNNKYILIAVDSKTGFIKCIPLKSKNTADVTAGLNEINSFFNLYNCKVKRYTADDEAVFHAIKKAMEGQQIRVTYTGAYRHNRQVERYIQTLQRRRDAWMAQLSYAFPAILACEALLVTANHMNMVPCTLSAPFCPYELVTKQKPILSEFIPGQTGIAHYGGTDKRHGKPGEWGIFLEKVGDRLYRVYIPEFNDVYTRTKFVPNDSYPLSWKLSPRIKPKIDLAPIKNPHQRVSPPSPPVVPVSNPFAPLDLDVAKDDDESAIPDDDSSNRNNNSVSVSTLDDHSSRSSMNTDVSTPSTIISDISSVSTNASTVVEQPFAAPLPAPALPPAIELLVPLVPPAPPAPIPAAPIAPIQRPPTRHHAIAGRVHIREALAQLEDDNFLIMEDKVSTYSKEELVLLNQQLNLLKNPEKADAVQLGLEKEVDNFVITDSLRPVHIHDIPPEAQESILPTMLLPREKDGGVIKIRLVALGNKEHEENIGATFSPTIVPASVSTISS